MISRRTTFCLFLCIVATKASGEIDAGYQYYVYVSSPSPPQNATPQDEQDAKAIVDGKMSDQVFASILTYREKIRRMSILQQTGVSNGGKEYIADNYLPQDASNTPFKDMIYGLTKDENLVLGGYLKNFFDRRDETWIIIAMVLTKDMEKMISMFDATHKPETFKDLRKKQRHPFENMLRVWVNKNREPNEPGEPNQSDVMKDVEDLQKEYHSGGGAWHGSGWQESRGYLEKILMRKSIKYARAVIQEFEKGNDKKRMEDIIISSVHDYALNYDLADAYSSLVRYIKNRQQYIADVLNQHIDGTDRWAAWIICLAVVTPQEWPLINDALTKDPKNDPLSKLITTKLVDNKIMAEMIAAIVDPKFKPTAFVPKLAQQSAATPATPLPPASPTTVLPSV